MKKGWNVKEARKMWTSKKANFLGETWGLGYGKRAGEEEVDLKDKVELRTLTNEHIKYEKGEGRTQALLTI